MNVLGLDGKTYKWHYSKYYKRKHRNTSDLHKRVREFLEQKFKNHSIYEEVTLPGSDLYADFWIPSLRIIVEAHGEQHYKHIPFFHKTYGDFIKAQYRDKKKKEWCELNNFDLIIIPFDTDWSKYD